VSGDASGSNGLLAGCDAWYSVIAGLFPQAALAITRAARAGNAQEARQLADRLAPLWTLFSQYGSVRVIAAAAELRGLVAAPSLPLPLRSLEGDARQRLHAVLDELDLA
jgi:4-hydroxy-tetrahydrodipicolinate synthase